MYFKHSVCRYINELIEYVVLNAKDHDSRDGAGESSQPYDLYIPPKISDPSLGKSMAASKQQRDVSKEGETSLSTLKSSGGDPLQPRSADWARVFEAATQRRTEVLAPENLENMWTKGRNYKTKRGNVKAEVMPPPAKKFSGTKSAIPVKELRKDMVTSSPGSHVVLDDEAVVQVAHGSHVVSQLKDDNFVEQSSHSPTKGPLFGEVYHTDGLKDHNTLPVNGNKTHLKRSSSTSALNTQTGSEKVFTIEDGRTIFSDFYSPDFSRNKNEQIGSASDMVLRTDGLLHSPKLRCRVGESSKLLSYMFVIDSDFLFGQNI